MNSHESRPFWCTATLRHRDIHKAQIATAELRGTLAYATELHRRAFGRQSSDFDVCNSYTCNQGLQLLQSLLLKNPQLCLHSIDQRLHAIGGAIIIEFRSQSPA